MNRASFIASVFGILGVLLLPSLSHAAQEPSPSHDEPVTVLHVDTREAVIEVVARDRRNLPIVDLAASEFEVYEFQSHGSRIQRRILWMRAINPVHKKVENPSSDGFQVHSGAVCALDATVHYELAIQTSAEPGFHTILVRTTRAHIQLSFRRQYYVGLRRDNATPQELKKLVTPAALNEAACYHPLTPPTLAITARILDSAVGNTTRYEVVIKPESVGDVGINGVEPRVDLDFGMCVFDDAGEVAGYLRSTVDHKLSTADIARLQDHGFVSLLETPGKEPPPLARLVVLDRNTGNLGIVDVAKPLPVAAQSKQDRKKRKLIGDVRAFGAVTPSENAFCGDVYELPINTSALSSFDVLDPVGSIYTNALNVPDQDITQMGGIPGVTHSSLWFGVDYYGRFYVTKPGEYAFELSSDDGSRLEIDDDVLIDLDGVHPVARQTTKRTLTAGWHSIHVPYFQGPPTSLALVLMIKPPGEAMRPFNLNEFAPTAVGR